MGGKTGKERLRKKIRFKVLPSLQFSFFLVYCTHEAYVMVIPLIFSFLEAIVSLWNHFSHVIKYLILWNIYETADLYEHYLHRSNKVYGLSYII